MHFNKILRLGFIAISLVFLFTLVSTPKTNCQTCKLYSNEGEIDGYEAFDIFEDACISYRRPDDSSVELLPDFSNINFENSKNPNKLEPLYANLDNINISYDKNGNQVLDIAPEDISYSDDSTK